MTCIGCDAVIATAPAAFAIMHDRDVPEGKAANITGAGPFCGYAICLECFTDPAHRRRLLKGHFAIPSDVERMVGAAGSSTGIG